jgi:biotin carboxyl carrier protein
MEEENKDVPVAEEVKYEYLKVYEGAKFKTLLCRSYRNRKPYAPPDPTIIKSFIPGTIRKVYIKAGQKVKKGDKLCALEAMKMLNEITTSMNGIVKTIHVKTGMTVANHQVLVELEKPAKKAKAKK